MENQESRKIWFLVIGLVVFVFCVSSATYAYFALTVSNNTITGAVGGATLSLSVTKIVPTAVTTNMIPQLESTLSDAISSTYNCVDGNGNVVCQVYKATVTNTGSTSAKLTGTISFTNITNMPNLKWRRIIDATSLGEYSSFKATTNEAIFEEEKLFAPTESADYYFVIWINETGEVQTDTGTFRATINFKTADGDGLTSTIKPTYLSETIVDLYHDGSELKTVNIGESTSNPSVTMNATRGIMLDNNEEYRYYGSNPNNYVSFNGELWRIIGVSNVKSSEDDTKGSARVKIIRNDVLGSYSWDSSETVNSGMGVNDWTQADLMTELNTLYYNSQSGICYTYQSNESATCDFTTIGLSEESRNLIADALWYLGGKSSISGLYANDYYIFERGTTVYGCSTDDGSCPRATIWTGKIGLMYLSDYVYATDLNLCIGYPEKWRSTDNEDCKANDWLYNSSYNQWSISSHSGYAYTAFVVESSSSVGRSAACADNGVRPVVYLRSNVTILGGEGTSINPYTLSLG